MQNDDVEIKKSDCVYNGVFQVNKLTLRFKQNSGQWSPWIEREQVSRHNAVAVLLYDPNSDKVVMVEQLRIGALTLDNSHRPWMVEIVAGLCDHDEPIEETAKRESREEADCSIERLIPIMDFYTTPGGFTEKTHVFCGIIDAKSVGEHCGNPDEHEDIAVKVYPAQTILDELAQGKLITSGSSAIALLWLQSKRQQPYWDWQ